MVMGKTMVENEQDSDQINSSEFQVPASDNKGHSVRMAMRVSPQLAMQVDLILGSKKFPYRTDSELLRHALMKHCRWLMKAAPGIESLMPQIAAINEVVRMSEEHSQFEEVVEKVVREATALSSNGNIRKAKELVDKIDKQIDKMPDKYWRGKYKAEISSKLGHLMSRPASVHPGDFVGDKQQ